MLRQGGRSAEPTPMHVAFFNRSFYPDTAAIGQLLTELCEGLVGTHGCRVSVVAGVPLQVIDEDVCVYEERPGARRHLVVFGHVPQEPLRGAASPAPQGVA